MWTQFSGIYLIFLPKPLWFHSYLSITLTATEETVFYNLWAFFTGENILPSWKLKNLKILPDKKLGNYELEYCFVEYCFDTFLNS